MMTNRDLAPNLPEETKKTKVDFFKTSLQPSKRPLEDFENGQTIMINSQTRATLIIKAKSKNSSSVVTTTKKQNIWPSNWIDYETKQAGMEVIIHF